MTEYGGVGDKREKEENNRTSPSYRTKLVFVWWLIGGYESSARKKRSGEGVMQALQADVESQGWAGQRKRKRQG